MTAAPVARDTFASTSPVRRRLLRVARGLANRLRPHVRGRRIPRERDIALAVPFDAPLGVATSNRRLAIVCHLFYAELASEMLACARCVPGPVDVFISTDSAAKRGAIVEAFEGFAAGRLDVRLVPNKGRDIGPKLCAFSDVYDAYEIVLLLHGKKTPEFGKGAAWRRTLLASLAGCPDTVSSILAIFDARPDIGMVIPQHFEPIRPFIGWHHNFEAARSLAARMGLALTPRHTLDLPSGSMFWTRSQALRPLLDLGLTLDDFPDETGQTNGTPAHAIERLFLFTCERAGYTWAKVCAPSLYRDQSTIRRIGGIADLDRFVTNETYRLLEMSR